MGHAAVERQARDVHEPVEAGRELDEGPELLEPSHDAAHARSHRETLRRRRPRIGRERPEGQPDAATTLRVGLELHDLRLDALADLEHLGRVTGAGIAELAHVDQAVDAPEIDERPEVAERRDGA